MNETIAIKGTREGLTVTVGSGDWQPMLDQLTQHLRSQGAFFRGGAVALQVGERALTEQDLRQVAELLSGHEMALRTVFTTNPTTEQSVRTLGLRLQAAQSPTEAAAPRAPSSAPAISRILESRGVLIRHLVRSGQVIRQGGHVVIVGDVNPGAEVVAGGDVIIWGRLYGMVHAGTSGNGQSVVCALDLAPLLLRIGDVIARPTDDSRPSKPYPEIAYVQDCRIVVEPWDRASRGV